MKAYKPYLSLDIETTGLNPESSVIQIAAVWDNNPEVAPTSLPNFQATIQLHGYIHVEHFALGMNGKLLELASKEGRPLKSVLDSWGLFITELFYINGEKKLTVAGKNAASFDIPVMKHNGFNTSHFIHRVLDVGPLYFPDFGYVPNLTEINKLNGRDSVAHTAYEDCLDVIHAIRAKMGVR